SLLLPPLLRKWYRKSRYLCSLRVPSIPASHYPDTVTTYIHTLSLHDALPISRPRRPPARYTTGDICRPAGDPSRTARRRGAAPRSEEHTSELQSRENLVCRLLLDNKKQTVLLRNKIIYIDKNCSTVPLSIIWI